MMSAWKLWADLSLSCVLLFSSLASWSPVLTYQTPAAGWVWVIG
jgi:hypothetical protein